MSVCFRVFGSSVSPLPWIEVRSCSFATFNEISKLMNMETMLPRSKSSNLHINFALLTFNMCKLNQAIYS